ncbi:uncharacterized protein LOC122962947 [Acropora millepora]|uniref:uncharacterized protein LOC122962947 n=1 Tax=Acropora millepora TaxID=45264 RepID=UPI001CF1A5C2|nr:uncharacterized protein LOC122962947 [Acropora millepora]
MTFPERNACLADAWSSLTTAERDYFNSRAKTEKVIPTKEQIKRTLKRISNECDNLKDLGVKCLFISDNDGTGTMEVYGHPSAVRFAESSQLAAKFFAFVNGEGRGVQQRKTNEEEKVLLRRQVQELFNEKYSKLCGGSLKVPTKR